MSGSIFFAGKQLFCDFIPIVRTGYRDTIPSRSQVQVQNNPRLRFSTATGQSLHVPLSAFAPRLPLRALETHTYNCSRLGLKRGNY